MPVTGIVNFSTFTLHVAIKPPSAVVTMIIAVPSEMAVTSPVDETVATDALLLLQFTVRFVAVAGDTAAVNCSVAAICIVRDVLLRVMPVTGIVNFSTFTLHVAIKPPPAVAALITVVPSATAVTNPVDEIVATVALLLLQDTFLFVAFAGNTVSVSCAVSAICMARDD